MQRGLDGWRRCDTLRERLLEEAARLEGAEDEERRERLCEVRRTRGDNAATTACRATGGTRRDFATRLDATRQDGTGGEVMA